MQSHPTSSCADVFGLSRGVTDDRETKVLSSFFVNRVANGNEKRSAPLEGEYVVDLKVYRTNDIQGVDPIDAWRKALIRVKLQTTEDSEQWRALQRFVHKTDEIFKEDPKFYKDAK